jgi:hypothetical protein
MIKENFETMESVNGQLLYVTQKEKIEIQEAQS